ncbi:MAG: alpha/beta fold hydrolase [Chloroflexi bacterium]|nr:alpha/beta fold hydrolase [Chloroflexota bacterium]
MSLSSSSSSKANSRQGSEVHHSGEDNAVAEMAQSPLSKPRPFRWLVRIAVFVVGLILAGTIYESVTEAADIQAYPPLGQMVDVGGYRLHINCTGTGSPTVIIEAGLGDWSLPWNAVQEEVAKTTRVCTYDRAGMGYSEASPLPRTAEQFAYELHTLLERANVEGPYVLAGHSLGGLTVRIFVHDYPTEVAGVVLIDSMSPGQRAQSQMEMAAQTSYQPSAFAIPFFLGRIGLVRVLAAPLGLISKLPAETQPAYAAFAVTPRTAQEWVDEFVNLQLSLAQADAVSSFGDLPLIVLTAALNQQANWLTMQTELLQLSSDSQQIVVADSGHNIHLDQPEAAVTAIVDMVSQLR